MQPYIAECIECGKKYYMEYPTTRPVSHIVDIVPTLCPECEEKMQWQQVKPWW